MKQLSSILLLSIAVFFFACSGQNDQLVKEIDAQVDSIASKSKDLEQKTYQNPANSENLTGFYGEDGKPVILKFDSYPDFVQYYYNNKGIICIIHNVIGEGGVSGSESKYYYKDGKLIYYLNNKEVREITAEVVKASKELLAIEEEYIKTLLQNGKANGQNQNQNQNQTASGGLDFLNDFVDKPSSDVSSDDRLISRLKALVKNNDDYQNLISQLAYGDEIQKFNNVIVINGEVKATVDEAGNQVTFVSIIVADLANDVLSVGMTDEAGNTSIFYTEAPGKKYPKQLVDWFTKEYKAKFNLVEQ
jgi:hypothetical protein